MVARFVDVSESELINNFIFSNNHQCNYTKTTIISSFKTAENLMPEKLVLRNRSMNVKKHGSKYYFCFSVHGE